ncbi:MAG: hypothetical protein ACRD8Z_10570, partial [Nitrososphaeraceae archaeon]
MFGKRVYNYEIDKAVCKAILKYSINTSRRKLKQILESNDYLGKKIPNKVFQYHIQRMLKAGYICHKKDKWVRGKKLPLFLANKTREQLRLDNLNIEFQEEEHSNLLNSYKKLKKRNESIEDRSKSELKRNRIYYIIMRALSIETPNKHYSYLGLSITDIINARYDGHAFYFLRLEDEKHLVEECISNLKEERIVKETTLPSQDESRYELIDPRWKSFVTECAQLLEDSLLMHLHLKWKN